MSLTPWQRVCQEFEVKNPWWTYRKDRTILPNGRPGEYHFVHVRGSSMILPVLPDGRLILVNQYRYLGNRESLEFPCGSVKENSSYEETAIEELSEETGYRSQSLHLAGQFNPYNGVTDELCSVYIARGLTVVPSHHDETEEFEQVRLTPSEISGEIRGGRIWDGMTLAAWMLAGYLFGETK